MKAEFQVLKAKPKISLFSHVTQLAKRLAGQQQLDRLFTIGLGVMFAALRCFIRLASKVTGSVHRFGATSAVRGMAFLKVSSVE